MTITIIILAVSAAFFMIGKIRSDLVALCALVLLILFGILTPEEALSGFSNSVVIMMIGLFVVGGAIFQTGLAKMISSRIVEFAGKNELKLFVLVMIVTAVIGAFVSNTGTVALMLPIVVSIAMSNPNLNASRLLMPLAFASSMGGMMTLIGTPPNLVIQDVLMTAGYKPLTFFTFTPVGVVCLVIGLLVLIPLSKVFLTEKLDKSNKDSKNKSLVELAREYQLAQNLYRVKVDSNSPFVNKMIKELDLSHYNILILEIHRSEDNSKRLFKRVNNQEFVSADTIIWQNDILYMLGEFYSVQTIAKDNGLILVDSHTVEDSQSNSTDSRFFSQEIGIAEILLMQDSQLINLMVKNSGFRQQFGVSILGIQRNRHYLLNNIKDEKMHNGDILLVQGTWANISRLSEYQSELVVLGQPLKEAAKVTLDHKAPIAAMIMLGMVFMMMFDWIPVAPVTAVVVAALLMVFTGCLRNVEAAYKTINWESVVLIAAMMPMSMALEKTGASKLMSDSLVDWFGSYGPYALLAGIYFATSLTTMFISNTATAVLMAPIALQSSIMLEISPYPFLFAVTVAASMCFASPFSTPPNALVMPAGRYTFMDYVKVGLPLQIVMGIVMIFVLPILFPF